MFYFLINDLFIFFSVKAVYKQTDVY